MLRRLFFLKLLLLKKKGIFENFLFMNYLEQNSRYMYTQFEIISYFIIRVQSIRNSNISRHHRPANDNCYVIIKHSMNCKSEKAIS